MLLPDRLVEKLIDFGPGQLEDLLSKQQETGKSLQKLVLEENIINEKQLTEKYAQELGVDFIEINRKKIAPADLARIPEPVARQYKAVVFNTSKKTGRVDLAMDDPEDIQAVNFLQKELGPKLKIYIATSSNIQEALDLFRGDVGEELSDVIRTQQGNEGLAEVNEEDLAEDSPIAQTVNLLLEFAIKSNASDVHIEPREDHVQIRYRIDGVLREVNRLPKQVMNALVSRIKILSNLKIDERRVPQDGRFKINLASSQYAFRVSTLPVADGEKVVMRILSESSDALTLKQLGIWGKSLQIVNQSITQPNGMLLVTGPTGSGKSTTLHSVLSILNTADVNISTIEDPVEYKIPGVNQTQVNPKAGMTFAFGLRALLRQDPNIIMVGEIRDGETANLGVQAALTGHLVFSTLHTNNAATCLPRLLDMQIEPFLIASTVNSVIGQRLVRRLCKKCRERLEITAKIKEQYSNMLESGTDIPIKQLHQLEIQALKDGVGEQSPELNTSETAITHIWVAHEGGCEECTKTGYRGRIGIYEVLDNSPAVQKLIVSNATADDIQAVAVSEGMITMKTDGIIKALRGETSLEEVYGATKD